MVDKVSSVFDLYKYRYAALLLPVLLWVSLYVYATSKSMIFAGDTLEYLRMANDVANGRMPVSVAWMPLFSILTGFISWISGLDLFVSVRLLNGLVTGTLIFAVNYILLFKYKIKWHKYILSNSIFFSSVTFLTHSVTMMPEILFLSVTLLFIYQLYCFIRTGCPLTSKWLITFSLTIAVSWLVKYNGFVNLALLITTILYMNRSRKSLFFALAVTIINIFLYSVWLKIKSTPDFLLKPALKGSIFNSNFSEFFSLQISDMVKTLFVYFGTDRVYIFFKENDFPVLLNLIILFFVFSFLIAILINGLKTNRYIISIISAYILIYMLMINARAFASGVTELNSRTLFYPLFLITVLYLYFAVFLKQLKSDYQNMLKILLLGSFVLFSLVQIRRVVSFADLYYKSMTNISLLGDRRFSRTDSKLMTALMSQVEVRELPFTSVLTNQEKILGIYNNFTPAGKIPSNEIFNGNRNLVNEKVFEEKRLLADSMIYSGRAILAFFHPRTGAVLPQDVKYVSQLDTNLVKIEFFPEGFLISAPK